jgi:hypothetical protein
VGAMPSVLRLVTAQSSRDVPVSTERTVALEDGPGRAALGERSQAG